jgi:hypothetical protein
VTEPSIAGFLQDTALCLTRTLRPQRRPPDAHDAHAARGPESRHHRRPREAVCRTPALDERRTCRRSGASATWADPARGGT